MKSCLLVTVMCLRDEFLFHHIFICEHVRVIFNVKCATYDVGIRMCFGMKTEYHVHDPEMHDHQRLLTPPVSKAESQPGATSTAH
jgi:hypothetical protein